MAPSRLPSVSTNIALLITFTCTSITKADESDYFCFDESERVSLQFANNPLKNISHLPTIRLIQGYYPSQFAMQYVAYVYLKEQMGVDATFYPTNDPNALFERYAGYIADHWCGVTNTSNCSEYAPYPRFYFEDIKNDEYDLLFEIWDLMIRTGLGFSYFENDEVLDGGISGVYGEGGWFVPKYIYDEHQEWTLPHQIQYNETVRQLYIDAYTIHSDIDYVAEWWDIWRDHLATYEQHGFGLPDYSKPIVFGSYEGYAISNHSGKLANNLLDNNWTFAAFGDEGSLTDFVVDLYSKRLPFVANLYSPHLDFATILPNDTEYMQFERIALPRNPNNDVHDVCYREGECTFPLTPLYKLGNPKLQETFPEIVSFLDNFRMTTNDVNDVIAYYEEAAALNAVLSEHELWINASCKWLKQQQSTTAEWYQDITRYDCIFDAEDEQQNNCGFNYYYVSFEDAQNDNNPQPVSWQRSIAGQCTNSSDEPLCDCSHSLLSGVNCRQSCPGIVGPIYNHDTSTMYGSVLNESLLLVGNYSFYLCNGNGACKIDHKTCECQAGFGGTDCGVEYQLFSYPTGFIVLWCMLFCICILVCLFSIYWVIHNKQYKTIRALSPNLSILFTVGLILLCLYDWICNSRAMIYGVGAIMTIAAPLLKTYRVAIIFAQARHMKKIIISDRKLMVYLINAVILESVICTVYIILHQVYGGVQEIYWDEFNRIEIICNHSPPVLYVESANYLYIFTLIVILCFFSYKNRPTHKVFKESRCIYFGSFFSLFVFLVVVLFNAVVDDISVMIHIHCFALFIALLVVWSLFYGVRMFKFYKYPEQRMAVWATSSGKKKYERSQTDQLSKKNNIEMPSYVNELYKQHGFEGSTREKAGSDSAISPDASEMRIRTPSAAPTLETVTENAETLDVP